MAGEAEKAERLEEASALAGEVELVDAEAENEEDTSEVGFGFGHGYDFTIIGSTCDLKCVCNEAAFCRATVEIDLLQLRGAENGGSCVPKDNLIQAAAEVPAVLRVPCPVVDGEKGVRVVPIDAVEFDENAVAAGAEVDGGVGAEGERSHMAVVTCRAKSQGAAIELDAGIGSDGIIRRDQQ